MTLIEIPKMKEEKNRPTIMYNVHINMILEKVKTFVQRTSFENVFPITVNPLNRLIQQTQSFSRTPEIRRKKVRPGHRISSRIQTRELDLEK